MKSLIFAFAVVALPPLALAADLTQVCRDLLIQGPPADLVKVVHSKEAHIRRKQAEREFDERHLRELEPKIEQIKSELTWENSKIKVWLARTFGGDTDRINRLRGYQYKVDELKERLARDPKKDSEADRAMVLESIDRYFRVHNEAYRLLKESILDNQLLIDVSAEVQREQQLMIDAVNKFLCEMRLRCNSIKP